MTANTAQAQAWNGGDGRLFVAENARHERMLAPHTVRLLDAAKIQPAESVLDIGCGCGETTVRAARAAAGGHALGVDLSAVMLTEARRLAAREGISSASFEQADAQTWSFPPAAFDVAISRFGVMFFDDPTAAFANIAAALRPGGRLAFTCWQEPGRIEYLTVPFTAIARHITPPPLAGPDEPGPFSLAGPSNPRAAGRRRIRQCQRRGPDRARLDRAGRRRRHRLLPVHAVRPAAPRRRRCEHRRGDQAVAARRAAPPPARRRRDPRIGRLAGYRQQMTAHRHSPNRHPQEREGDMLDGH